MVERRSPACAADTDPNTVTNAKRRHPVRGCGPSNLSVLTAGRSSADPYTLLHSPRLGELFSTARRDYDRVFAAYFKGIGELPPDLLAQIPEEWLRRQAELLLTDEEKELIRSLEGTATRRVKVRAGALEIEVERRESAPVWTGAAHAGAGAAPAGAPAEAPSAAAAVMPVVAPLVGVFYAIALWLRPSMQPDATRRSGF